MAMHRLHDDHSVDCSSHMTIHRQFTRAAHTYPDATALVQGNVSVSYSNLLHGALAFAGHCIASGVGKGTLVAIDSSRTIETITNLLGILYAGGVYVPVDVHDCNTAALLHRHKILFLATNAKDAAVRQNATLLTHQTLCETGTLSPDELSGSECVSDDPAYVLFTSGSTGARRGVIVPHRGVVRLVNGQQFVQMNNRERILLHSPLTFDASTFELWGALLHGGTVVLAHAGPLALEDFYRLVTEHQISTLWLSAGLFHLAARYTIEIFSPLRQLIVGGDVIDAMAFAKVKRRAPQLRLVNGYGPTENTTFTTCYVAPIGFAAEKVPIGVPLVGTTVLILDEQSVPVPDGVAGELVAGGEGVALGYIDEPELTATRFRTDFTRDSDGARLYFTGDIVRRLADGQLDFLGRKDGEVKLAGQRFQLEDVEHEILISGLVDSCAAFAVESPDQEKTLVAFVVWRATSSEKLLRQALAGKLPRIAIPKIICAAESLPLSTNGKVDRISLRDQFLRRQPALSHSKTSSTGSLPRGYWLQEIERLWCKLLHRDAIDPTANFFDLGGDSLTLIRFQAELRGLTPDAPTILELFSLPTATKIAEYLEYSQKPRIASERPAIACFAAADQSPVPAGVPL